jgi:mercuric reductase
VSLKVANAVARLKEILPLAARQKDLNHETANVYQMILSSYVFQGRTLNKSEISEQVGNLDQVINTLRVHDMVVFDANDEPVGAYPFTMEPRDHKVSINGHTVYAMCALDALAISPMYKLETHIDSSCHVSGASISIDQLDQEVLNRAENTDIHFGINWNSAANNCCATSLCNEMIFLKNIELAQSWLIEDSQNRELFALDEAIDFAAQYFTPLIDIK